MYRDFIYKNCKVEKLAYNVQKDGYKNYEKRKNNSNSGQIRSSVRQKNITTIQGQRGSKREIQGPEEYFRTNIRGNREISGRNSKETDSRIVGQGAQSVQDEIKIEKSGKDKIYDWHADIETKRFDVNKTLQSTINISNSLAKELSKTKGIKNLSPKNRKREIKLKKVILLFLQFRLLRLRVLTFYIPYMRPVPQPSDRVPYSLLPLK